MNTHFSILCAFVLRALFAAPSLAANPLNDGTITIIIKPVFDNQPLNLMNQYYVNEHGDTLYVDVFRFYMTNVNVIGANNAINTNAHLLDAADSNTMRFTVNNITQGRIDALQFMIGVDSIANTSGANGGDLDPAKGMYWAWNSGYIMAKLEGRSKVCKTLHHAFEFHIGGYMPPYNAVRPVTVKLPHAVDVTNSGNTVITIKADVAAWFKGNLDLSHTNDIVIPGKSANAMADNYAQMFSVNE